MSRFATENSKFYVHVIYTLVAGAGIGSSVQDMDSMFAQTRYVANLSTNYGGSANAYYYTGLGKN